jgi:hypothetical protein
MNLDSNLSHVEQQAQSKPKIQLRASDTKVTTQNPRNSDELQLDVFRLALILAASFSGQNRYDLLLLRDGQWAAYLAWWKGAAESPGTLD